MARYNEILTGRYNRFFQKLFGMKGGPPAPQLSGDIQPSFALFSGVEHRYLESWDRFGTATVLGPAVGQTDAVRFRNPAASNVVACVEKLTIGSPVAQEIDLSIGATAADFTGFASFPLDSRGQRQGSTLSSSTSVASPTALNIIGRFQVIVGQAYDVIVDADQQLTILPGQALQIGNTNANAGLFVSMWWRERALEEGERQ